MRNQYILAFILLLLACTENNRRGLPESTGKPYEVLIVAESVAAGKSVATLLATPVEALPQREPQFDESFCQRKKFDAMRQLARNIVIIDENKKLYTRTTIRFDRDVYAAPQIVIHIQTPHLQALEQAMMRGKAGKELLSLLNRHELTIQKKRLEREHNPKAEERIRQMFGIEMLIPSNMLASKEGKDFLWLSNNANTGMQNICLFRSEKIDSVLKANIKGEKDEMYMRRTKVTAKRLPETSAKRLSTRSNLFACQSKNGAQEELGNETVTIQRGLWEMVGDAMGGPYVARTLYLPTPGKELQAGVFTIFTFVYAPESTKRNKIRQLEAVLYTIK